MCWGYGCVRVVSVFKRPLNNRGGPCTNGTNVRSNRGAGSFTRLGHQDFVARRPSSPWQKSRGSRGGLLRSIGAK